MRQYFVVILFSAFFYTVCNEAENICESDVCAQICNPVGDSYKCDCMKGFTLMADGISCKPQKRALKKGGRCENNNPCDQDCIDTGTAIKCSCREGYELAKDERTCKDIDECALQLHDCKANEECENEIGTYSCYEPFFGENDINFDEKCPPGYKFNIENEVCDDIDECQFELMCIAPKTCKNTIGSFFCEEPTPKCPPGFYLKPETGVCDDINECEQAQNCNQDEDCLNEPGGYKCLPKTTTQRSTTTTTTTTTTKPSPRPTTRKPVSCPQGYSYVEWTKDCEDINECQSGVHKCDVLERCDNTIGSYHCSRIYGCGTGYTLNLANGLCEDDDECLLGTHNCKQLGKNFRCKNTLGSYRCEAFRETPSRYRPVAAVPNLSPARTYPTVPTNPSTPSSTPSSTTSTIYSTTSSESTTTTAATYRNYSRTSVYEPPFISSKAYTTSLSSTTPKISTTPKSSRSYTITFLPPPSTPAVIPYIPQRLPTTSETPPRGFSMHHPNIPLIIPYFPQRGHTTPEEPYRDFATPFYHHVIGGQLKKCLPGYKINIRGECEDIDECQSNPCGKNEKCLNFNGRYECAAPMQCRKGYELNEAGDQCIDIDECTRNVHKCHSTQICKNYQGFYTCDCPPGHQLRMNQCLDIDECKLFRPCGSYADCINTKGSFSCECKAGFRTNGAACEEIDECSETASLCDQKCVNIWGSYRCSCNLGFTLNSDNRTCTDIDECERFKDKRLCIGTCKNIPGSYTCECPKGYHLGSDGRICKDIDECEQNVCLHDEVCLNLKGSFRCYSIKCPENYIKDPSHKTRCKRLQHVCDPRDYNCLSQPGQFTYQYIAMVSNLPLPSGPLQIFEIKGPKLDSARAEYSVKLLDVICTFGVKKVDDSYFHKVTDQINSISVFLVKSIQGPQEVKIQIHIRFFNGNIMIGNTVVYVIIVVSEYTF